MQDSFLISDLKYEVEKWSEPRIVMGSSFRGFHGARRNGCVEEREITV